jgi:uncharacterized membrane protein YjgN (DUF898 family)
MQDFPPPVVAAPTPWAPAPQVERHLPFRFTGTVSEYFRIWIVNTLLTIATLGIYSAWAKVRNKQYFYRHTWVDDASFEYLASPIAILKGRLIVAAVLGLLFASQHYSLPLYFGLIFLVILMTPWVLVRSLAFNARNSAYRNVRFSFLGNAGEAFALYLLMGLFHAVTCGLAYPYVQWRFTEFLTTRHIYGDHRFTWHAKSGDYYRVYLIALAMTLPVFFFGMMFAVGAAALGGHESGPTPPAGIQAGLVAFTVVLYAFLLIPGTYVRAHIANLVYGRLAIGSHYLSSNQRARDLLRLYVTNVLAIVFTLGLMIPWAKIRLAKYRASCLTLHALGPIEASSLTLDRDPSAIGDAAVDLGDFNIDFGL